MPFTTEPNATVANVRGMPAGSPPAPPFTSRSSSLPPSIPPYKFDHRRVFRNVELCPGMETRAATTWTGPNGQTSGCEIRQISDGTVYRLGSETENLPVTRGEIVHALRTRSAYPPQIRSESSRNCTGIIKDDPVDIVSYRKVPRVSRYLQ